MMIIDVNDELELDEWGGQGDQVGMGGETMPSYQ
jgi:hypothetical protein